MSWPQRSTQAGLSLPVAVSDPLTNYNNIMAIVVAAGAGGVISAPANQIYTLCQQIVLLDRQTLRMNGSTLKLADQVSSVISASSPATITSVSSNPTATFTVASSAGFFIGQSVTIDDQTVANTKTYLMVSATVIAIPSPTSVTVQIGVNAAGNFLVSSLTTTNIETRTASYTVPNGAKLVSISGLLSLPYGTSGSAVRDLIIDGNSANNPLGNRWETSCMLNNRAADSVLNNIRINTCPSDGIYVGNLRQSISSIWIDKPNAMGFHIGASTGSVGGSQTVISEVYIDSPGMGTAQIGHYGGLSSAFPAYPAIGFSQNTDKLVIKGLQLRNTSSASLAQGIGSIGNSTNLNLEFSDAYIDGMTRGAFQITGSAGDNPVDIDLNQIHVRNCAPVILNQSWNAGSGSDATFHSFIGSPAGSGIMLGRVRLRNSDFLDSPLGIMGTSDCELSNVMFAATALAKTSTLYIQGNAAVTDTTVTLNNVTCTRPTGAGTGAPAANQFSCNLYVSLATVRGNGVTTKGGHIPARLQGGADVAISNFYGENGYSFQVGVYSATTKVKLHSPVLINKSGIMNSSYSAVQNQSGGGNGGYTEVINPLIDLVTSSGTQYGISLSPNTVAGTGTTVIGGEVRVTGSGFPFLSGGASALNQVIGTAVRATQTLGGSEQNTSIAVANM